MNVFTESHWRTVAKIVTWRIILTGVNFTYTYVVTGSWQAGLTVAGLAAIFNTAIYWSHERVWNFISWGKKIKVDEKETVVYK